MTIDEAIKHTEEVAEEQEKLYRLCPVTDYGCKGDKHCKSMNYEYDGCLKCAEKHRQLAEWLKDYKRLLEQEPKTGHCEDCKHFRKLPYHADTLGKCIHHTGFCPKGDWYCADYESHESEVNNDNIFN